MTRVHSLSVFLICHHQTKFILASWPQDGCYGSRHHTKAMPARVRKEVVNICGPFSPRKESFPRVHFRQTQPSGLIGQVYVCTKINTMLLDNDLQEWESQQTKTPQYQKKRALDPETTVFWVQIPVLATQAIWWPGVSSVFPFIKWIHNCLVLVLFITAQPLTPRKLEPSKLQCSLGTFAFFLQQATLRCQNKPVIKENYTWAV